jgi:hypothetical protein
MKGEQIMQISLTKKLAGAMGIKPTEPKEIDPLFAWTANWVKVWSNRRNEDLLILVNNATRFVVAAYEVKRKNLKNVPEIMLAAIRNTLLDLNLNIEIVDEYLRLAGPIEFAANCDRRYTAWLNKAGNDCSFYIGRRYNYIEKMFSDTVGTPVNYRPVNYSHEHEDSFKPYEKMFAALAELTDKPVYNYRAYEIKLTLDLDIYKAVRRFIVPADIKLDKLHRLFQRVLSWKDYHLHNWCVYDEESRRPIHTIAMSEEDVIDDEELETEHVLSEYFPKYKNMLYTYDFGDNWGHVVEFVRAIDNYDKESPYLLEAVGQTPPEDVGGTRGYIEFRKIMLDPNHKDYSFAEEWSGYWSPELSEWERTPRVISDR